MEVRNVKPTDSQETVPDGGSSLEETDLFTRTADVPERTRREKFFRQFDVYIGSPLRVAFDDLRMVIGSALIIGFFLVGSIPTIEPLIHDLFGVWLVKPPAQNTFDLFAAPFQSLQYPLGTDNWGRDLLGLIVYATPAMLKLVIAGGLISAVIGTLIGTSSGYIGGWYDRVSMILTDTVLTIPAFPFIIVISIVWTIKDPVYIGLLLGIDNWPRLSRALRSQVLSIREEAATEAARAMGLSKITILRRYVIAALAPYILINLANSSKRVIFEAVALYYLGILSYSGLNWGVMLDEAYKNGALGNPDRLHWMLVPMVPIILLSMGFILVAQGMDRVFNVRLQAKHQTTEDETESQADLG